jgi:hypothetical protein
MTKVPAFHEEPRMPPEEQVRPWMLVYYTQDNKLAPDKYWKQFGKDLYTEYKSAMKPNDDVRKASAEIIGTAATPDENSRASSSSAAPRSRTSMRPPPSACRAKHAKKRKPISPSQTRCGAESAPAKTLICCSPRLPPLPDSTRALQGLPIATTSFLSGDAHR